MQSEPKTLNLTHNPQIKQLKTAHARSIDREKKYAVGSACLAILLTSIMRDADLSNCCGRFNTK